MTVKLISTVTTMYEIIGMPKPKSEEILNNYRMIVN